MSRPDLKAAQQLYGSRPADLLLPRLEAVKETGPGRWLARCPAHDDRRPSLSIRETGDGVLLLKCWAGCEVAHVAGAVGLDLSDLFPPRSDGGPPLRKGERWIPRDVLRALAGDLSLVVIAAGDLAAGRSVVGDDLAALEAAAARLGRALREVA